MLCLKGIMLDKVQTSAHANSYIADAPAANAEADAKAQNLHGDEVVLASKFDMSAAMVLEMNGDRTQSGDPPKKVMTTSDGTEVRQDDDAGAYYCEHIFYSGQQVASSSASIMSNRQGESLVGFLHVPNGNPGTLPEVVGAGLKGYANVVAGKTGGDIRLMVTGFGAFGSVQNNPTGAFARSAGDLDRAMQHAFGKDLLTPTGTNSANPKSAEQQREYQVRINGQTRTVVLRSDFLPVNDDAMDPNNPVSLPSSAREFRPHAMISLGVHGETAFEVEIEADNENLNGGQRQYGAATHQMPDNRSLARAIYNGKP